jgi:formamidopyrimidine-DNA glycosylase
VPELPEVETVVRDLRPAVVGRTVLSFRRGRKKLRRPWKPAWDRAIPGSHVEAIRRRGKWIVLDLEGGRHLLVHLGMTGRLTAVPAAAPEEPHTHLVFPLDNGTELRFSDIRRFGSATLLESREALQAFFESARLGPEPEELESRAWYGQLLSSSRPLKAMLLDQRLVAGVGNIYADEALFEARLHPALPGARVRLEESERLRKAILAVLERAIARRGSTIRNYVGGSGLRGGYQEEFRVYARTGKACLRCKTAITRLRLAGRSTHYCPKCQPANSK